MKSLFSLKKLMTLALFCFCLQAFSNDSPFVLLKGENPLIVTHADPLFDATKMAEDGLNKLVEKAKREGRSVYYLYRNKNWQRDWYLKDKDPTLSTLSYGGEHYFKVPFSEITVAGGFFGSDGSGGHGCLTVTISDLIRHHNFSSPLKINIVLSATYMYDHSYYAIYQPDELTDVYSEQSIQRKLFKNGKGYSVLRHFFEVKDIHSFLGYLVIHKVFENEHGSYFDPIDINTLFSDRERLYASPNLFVPLEGQKGHWKISSIDPRNWREDSNGSTKDGFRYILQIDNHSVGFLGVKGNKVVILNFVE